MIFVAAADKYRYSNKKKTVKESALGTCMYAMLSQYILYHFEDEDDDDDDDNKHQHFLIIQL